MYCYHDVHPVDEPSGVPKGLIGLLTRFHTNFPRHDARFSSCPRWKREEKWKNDSGDEEPKWKQNEKWKNNL